MTDWIRNTLRRLAALWQRQRDRFVQLRRERLLRRRGHGGAMPAPALQLDGPLPAVASVVIPALNEAERIADVVRYALADSATAEVIVIDDSSIDDTAALAAAAGARVVRSTMLGKGASMCDGVGVAAGEFIVYLDGDLSGLAPGVVTRLVRPLLADRADFVKARFERGAGRVTELTAKPMLRVFFPELARFAQPLGGLVGARRSLLRSLAFEDGYGVDVGLLIDAHRAGARLLEVDIGPLEHESQSLADLTLMANEVARVIYGRARAAGRLNIEQIDAVYESQRQATASLAYALTRRRGRTRVLLLSMDGVVTTTGFLPALAAATGASRALAELEEATAPAGVPVSPDSLAALFRFVHRERIERVAREIELREGLIDAVRELRRAGFMVGVLSDSWSVAAEIVRRRIFADFALANTLAFAGGVCTGEAQRNPAFAPLRPAAGAAAAPCLSHAVAHLREDLALPRVQSVWALGGRAADLPLLRAADRAFVIAPASSELARQAGATLIGGFEEMLPAAPAPVATAKAA